MPHLLLKEFEKGSKNSLIKKRIITHYIQNGCSTITELSKELDLSVPTVTKFIDEMCEDGYINDYGKLETSGGRHPSLYGLNAESGYFVGVEVRQFSIHLGLINFKGDVMQLKMNVPFRAKNTPECLDELCKIIKQFLQKLPIEQDKVLNINVNLSGRVNPDLGYSYSIFNFDERPLSDIISERISSSLTLVGDWVWVLSLMESFIKENPVSPVNLDIITDMKMRLSVIVAKKDV